MPPRAPPPPLVLVTGACGYGASHVVRRLLRPEASRGGAPAFAVRAGDLRVPQPGEPAHVAGAEYVVLDVTDAAACVRAAAGCRAVLHLAALVPYNLPAAHSRAALLRVNVEGTRNVVRACRAARVRSLVLASSTGVVFCGADIAGGAEGGGADEDAGIAAAALNDAYSESKALAERLVLRASFRGAGAGRGELEGAGTADAGASGEGVGVGVGVGVGEGEGVGEDALACVALRPNGIWGPGEAHHTPKLLLMARLGLAPLMAVAPAALTDFTHRDNLAHAFMLALARLEEGGARGARRRVAGRAFFVTDGWPVHTLEFFSPLLAALGFAAPFPSAVLPRSRAEALGLGAECRRLPGADFARAAAAADEIARDASSAAEAAAAAETPSASWAPRAATAASLPSGRKARRARGASAAGAGLEPLLVPAPEAGSESPAFSPLALTAAALGGAGAVAARGAALSGEEEVVFTSAPHLPLPGITLLPVAALLELGAWLLRPLVNVEPFLTRADVRKVVRHNYYSSARAARELGYKPVTSPAAGLRDAAAHYRAAGFRGEVEAAGWLPWLLAPGGIALTGAVSADALGALGLLLHALAALGAPPALCRTELLGAATRAIFAAAVAAHAAQAAAAFGVAFPRRLAAGAWAAQTLALGFPSSVLLARAAGLRVSAGAVRALCVALFLALLVPAWAVVASSRGLGLDGAPLAR